MAEERAGDGDGLLKKEKLVNILDDINVSAFLNQWGPMSVIHIYNPTLNMQGILVIDNIVLGPAIGRIDISSSITPRQVYEAARIMTWTCAVMDLRFGGAAGGIRADPALVDRNTHIRSFARKVSPYVPDKFVAAPGKGVGQEEIRAFIELIGDLQGATGKPAEMNGIPYELGCVGLGLGVAIETTLGIVGRNKGLPAQLSKARVAIEGLDGNIAKLVRYLASNGASIVAISDNECTASKRKGLDVNKILKYCSMDGDKGALKHFKDASIGPCEEVLKSDCDVLVLSERAATYSSDQFKKIKARCVVEAQENLLNPMMEQVLKKKDILIIPDILALAGGPICSYAEYTKNNCEKAFSMVDSKVRDVTRKAMEQAIENGLPLERVLTEMAKERIMKHMEGSD